MIRRIIMFGDRRLVTPSAPAPLPDGRPSREHLDLARDLREMMIKLKGFGLAAPQVGVNVRLFVVSIRFTGVPYFAIFNPEVISTAGEKLWKVESCFSVPGMSVRIARHEDIKVRFTTARGAVVDELQLIGSAARVFQHELDHLDGIVLGKTIKDMERADADAAAVAADRVVGRALRGL